MIAVAMLAAIAMQSVNADDSEACRPGGGPAIQVTVVGLKDRTGRLKLELYPGDAADFLKDDRDLVRQGKFFRRVWSSPPASGAVTLCIRAPAPGNYALLFTHDRDARNKFNIWKDGAGLPSNIALGRSRPALAQALIAVGPGITETTIRVQYLRGLPGFAPLAKD